MSEGLKDKILAYSYSHKLSHIGSCLTLVNALDAIYSIKRKEEKVVVSNGHSHLAHAIVKEAYGESNLEDMMKSGIHCDRDNGCDVSTGSLGQGLPIALGMALARMDQQVYCTISDGECSEGSIWEALRIAGEQTAINLRVVVISNGWGAYKQISGAELIDRFRAFGWGVIVIDDDVTEIKNALERPIPNLPVMVIVDTNVDKYPFLRGLQGHYRVMSQADYESIK